MKKVNRKASIIHTLQQLPKLKGYDTILSSGLNDSCI
jgi:hypothetical protein